MKRNRYKKIPTAIQHTSLFLPLSSPYARLDVQPEDKNKKPLILLLVILSFDTTHAARLLGPLYPRVFFCPTVGILGKLITYAIQQASNSKLTTQNQFKKVSNSESTPYATKCTH